MKVIIEISEKIEGTMRLDYSKKIAVPAEVVDENATKFVLKLPDGTIIRKNKSLCKAVEQ